MAVRERREKGFDLTGPITFLRSDVSPKTGQRYVILSVAGVSFFLPPEFHQEANFLDEWQIVTIRGEYAGDTVRNGQRQANLEVYEIIPLGRAALQATPPTIHANGMNGNATIPRVEKGQAA